MHLVDKYHGKDTGYSENETQARIDELRLIWDRIESETFTPYDPDEVLEPGTHSNHPAATATECDLEPTTRPAVITDLQRPHSPSPERDPEEEEARHLYSGD